MKLYTYKVDNVNGSLCWLGSQLLTFLIPGPKVDNLI